MKSEIIRFRVTLEEKEAINSLRMSGEDISSAARRVLLSSVKDNADPEKQRIALINSKVMEIDSKLIELNLDRELLIGRIENHLKKVKV